MMLILINQYFLNIMIFFLIVFIMIFNSRNFITSQDIDVCNRQFYIKPICIDQLNNYKCKCNPGFIWNGDMCVSTALNSYFEFDEKSPDGFVYYEKTFPRLTSFTLATWLQIYNYSTHTFHNDTRTIFTYSLENFVNVFQCQISSTLRNKHENPKKTQSSTNIYLTIKIYSHVCQIKFSHTYTNNFYWFHLTLTWNSSNGKIEIYLNGILKSTCLNIALNKEIHTAGVFILGQTHQEDFFAKQNKKDIFTTTNTPLDQMQFELQKSNEFALDFLSYSSSDNSSSANSNSPFTSSFFEKKFSFIGRIYDFNIWNYVKKSEGIMNIYKECRLSNCGNATQWSDFRQGTSGEVKMKWPTGLLWKKECFSESYQLESCNKFCNKEIGPVCRENIEKNIRWPLSRVNETIKVKCFPWLNDSNKYAYRHCDYLRELNNEYSLGYSHKQATTSWKTTNINDCIQEPFLNLKNQVFNFYSTDNFDEYQILVYLENLYDFTILYIKSNINNQRSIYDIDTVIDTLFYLINAQQQVIKRNLEINLGETKFNLGYPTYDETMKFSQYVLAIVDIMLSLSKETNLWSNSLPIGSESTRLVEVVNQLSTSIFDFQKLNLIIGLGEKDASLEQYIKVLSSKKNENNKNFFNNSIENIPQYIFIDLKYKHIVYRQQLIFHENQMPLKFKFPDKNKLKYENQTIKSSKHKDKNNINKKQNFSKKTTNLVTKSSTTSIVDNSIYDIEYTTSTSTYLDRYHFSPKQIQNQLPSAYFGLININDLALALPILKKNQFEQIDPYALLTVYYSGIETLLPNHNKTFRAKDNNLNSVVVTVDLIGSYGRVIINKDNFNSTLNKPLEIFFNYINNFNISDTRCVYLSKTDDKTKLFKWSRQECVLKDKNHNSASCDCYSFGTFSITNDLYDPNWSPPILENIPLSISSYLGCIIVCLFCLVTFFSLTILKTKSGTASVHKNLCISIFLSQVFIMISLSRFNYDNRVCHAFGLLNHYMYFAVFAWLMNEAFNLYITITYAAHQSSPINDAGSQWKFYLLGWLLPAVFVICLFLTRSNNYYDKKLCWFNLDNLWLNISPAVCMLAVTMLVMIFSDKEHRESSYTKNEKANKLIANHTKAVWTQIVLLSLCWSFGIMSLILFEPALKYLFAFLNCLQGSFLFTFYFLLNEEVRKYFKERKKKKKLKLKEKNLQLANLKDLIAQNELKSDDEEDEDDEDDEEDDDDNDNEDNQIFEAQTSPTFSLKNQKKDDELKNTNQNENSEILQNSFSSSLSKGALISKKNSSTSRSSMTKSVKFENPSNKFQSTNQNIQNPAVIVSPEKPNQLFLKTIVKPSSSSNYETIQNLNLNENKDNSSSSNNNNINDELVWPQFKKKLSFKYPYSYNNSSSNLYNSNGTGADLYETNEEKVTVL